MTVVLLIVGLLATAGGFVAIGFGIPNYAFGLGNTLIIAGSVSAATGLMLIGLAAVYGQLRRINAALKGAPGRLGRAAESVEAAGAARGAHDAGRAIAGPDPCRRPSRPDADAPPPLPPMFGSDAPQAAEPPRMPEPPRMSEPLRMPEPPPRMPEPRMPEPRMPEPPRAQEPRFPATASEPAPGPLDWLRSKSKPAAPSMPTPPYRCRPLRAAHANSAGSGRAAGAGSRGRSAAVAAAAAASHGARHGPSYGCSGRPAPNRRCRSPSRRATRTASISYGRTAARPLPRRRRAKPPSASLVSACRCRRSRRGRASQACRPPSAGTRQQGGAERGPAILKSGVIDGMPYTLYADGSIEAELPQGTVKFASVDALRSHLEKQS